MTGSADSIQTYREMLRLDPGSRVFVLLAEELSAAGEWEQVAEICGHGLKHHPDNLRAKVLLGWALMEMGEADESERVLNETVEDVRKNAIIFKLLSEFAMFSGNAANAAEYSRIYEAFEPSGASGPPLAESSPAAKEEARAWDDFKAEAIAELHGEGIDTKAPETPVKIGIEDILAHLAQRIEGRFATETAPGAIFSEEDRSFLKQELAAALSG
jgi:tetratricopeptide (TPR) repeat protein